MRQEARPGKRAPEEESQLKIRTNIDENYEIHSTSSKSIDKKHLAFGQRLSPDEAFDKFLSTYDKEYSVFFERIDKIKKSASRERLGPTAPALTRQVYSMRGGGKSSLELRRDSTRLQPAAEAPESERTLRNVRSERALNFRGFDMKRIKADSFPSDWDALETEGLRRAHAAQVARVRAECEARLQHQRAEFEEEIELMRAYTAQLEEALKDMIARADGGNDKLRGQPASPYLSYWMEKKRQAFLFSPGLSSLNASNHKQLQSLPSNPESLSPLPQPCPVVEENFETDQN